MTEPVGQSPETLGNDKGPVYAAPRRAEAILDEAVVSGALGPEERRVVGLYERQAATVRPPGIIPTTPLPKVIAACLDLLPHERRWDDFELHEWMEMFEGACRVWYRLPRQHDVGPAQLTGLVP